MNQSLEGADHKYLAVFEVKGDHLVGRHVRDQSAGDLGLACWKRLLALFPLEYRADIVQFNIQEGRSWAGQFDGDGSNDVGRRGYRLSIAKYAAEEEEELSDVRRPVKPRRGTLDWTMVHEMGHYICLVNNAIELFSQRFDGDTNPQPPRRENPQDYPEDGSPRLEGDFVTSYAEKNPGDEEAVESFTTYLLVEKLPDNRSLAARKIRFFETLPGLPELRQHLQKLGR